MRLTDIERDEWALTRQLGAPLFILKGTCFGACMGIAIAFVVYLRQGPVINWELAIALTIGWMISVTYLRTTRWYAMERAFREPVIAESV